jgi:TP901 family phage tail tape measure protein
MSVFIDVVSKFNDAGIDKARKELDKLSDATASSTQKLMKGAAVAGAGILAGAGAVAVGLYEIGSQFDDAFDGIRVGTGATGPALEQLQNDMKAVAGAVPASFGDAGLAITEFNRRLGLTGAPLQTLSSQVLELSRITNTDLTGNLEAVSSVMQNFGVDAGSQSSKLDLLFRASQASGLSVQELASSMSGAGVVLREVGLNFDQSAAFLATLGKAGVDASDVMPALSKSLAVAAKNGKDASAVFTDTFNAIKNAPNDVAASGVALEVFGAKAGPKLAAMIREGKLSYEEMTAAIAGGGETILGAGADTQDFAEKLTQLKNRVFLAIEPIATKVFGKIGEVMDQLGPKVEQLTAWMTEHKDVMMVVAGVIGGIVLITLAAYTASMISAAAATIAATWPILAVVAAIAVLVAAVIYAWNNWDWFREGVTTVWEAIKSAAIAAWNFLQPIFVSIGEWITGSLVPFFQSLASTAISVWGFISNAVVMAWNNVIKPIWDAIYFYVVNILIPYYQMLWNVAQNVWSWISAKISEAWNNVIKPIWDTIYNYVVNYLIPYWKMLWEIAQSVWDQISTKVSEAWNNVIKPIWDAIYGFVVNYLIPYWTLLWNTAQAVWDNITSKVSAAWGILSGVFDSIKNGIATVWGYFQTAKDTISNVFTNIADAISGPFKTAFNFISDAWNNTIGSLSWSVPGWIPVIGGNKIEAPKLPKFASGGFFNASMNGGAGLAVLHDNEMILNPQQQRALFSGEGLGGGTVYNINVNVSATADKAAVGQTIVEAIAAYERRSGDGWRAA